VTNIQLTADVLGLGVKCLFGFYSYTILVALGSICCCYFTL